MVIGTTSRTLSLDQTELAETAAAPAASAPLVTSTRSTVLPRIEGDGPTPSLVNASLARYEPMRLLGRGAMGEVVLVKDQDIARAVAVKRLLPDLHDPALIARFVDEIRTVGRLEHPNIVPIHDVGVDDLGRYFFVMKYVEGETLEAIVERLRAGDAETHERYAFEQRIELFLKILNALDFAHAHGFVHRDVKPANVMVGRYGEVVLMDWGIAKPVASPRDGATIAAATLGGDEGERARMYATQVGSLIGTPAYMSPEQARRDNHAVDARSDLYAATVLFHELMTLRHYLDHAHTLADLLRGIQEEHMGFLRLLSTTHAAQPSFPGEVVHFCIRGLAKDPAARFQSAREMITALEDILAGKVKIQCHVTLTKRSARSFGRLVDRHPMVAFSALITGVAAIVFAVFTLVSGLVRAR